MTEGIGLGMGFKLDAKSHLDVRKSFKTLEEMKNFPETSIPEGFTTFNEATGLEYQFLSTNEVSETLGKWRVKEYGSGNQWYTIVDKPLIRIDDLSNGNYLLNGNVENVMDYSNEICFIYITGTYCYITGLSGEQCAFKNNNGVWKPLYYDGFMLSKDVSKLMEKKIDKSSLLSNTKENATDKEVYSAKYINALKKLIDALSSIISDTSISTDTTYSSYKIDLDMSNMKDELKLYMNTAIAGLNKLSKEIINDKSLVVKDNVLYLYKADDDVSNNYMQMMLINGVAVELGSTQVDMSDYYNKTDSDNRFAAKLDLETLTTSFNDLVDKVAAIEDEIGTETLSTTSQTVKGAINEISDKSAIITLTKAEYEALAPKDPETYYITTDDMTMYKGESQVLGGNGKSLVGKETVLYDGSISATGTYTLADDVNNYDFIVINHSLNSKVYRQSLTMSKIEVSKCIDSEHRFICVYGYGSGNQFIAGHFNNDKLIIDNYAEEDINSIVGYKFGEVTVKNTVTITNPSPGASYSTDEQLTGGTWIDGKPIYRKTMYTATSVTNSFTKGAILFNITSLSVQKIISCTGIFIRTSDNTQCQLPYIITEGYQVCVQAVPSKISAFVGKNLTGKDWYITIEYTKTTD